MMEKVAIGVFTKYIVAIFIAELVQQSIDGKPAARLVE